MNSLCKMTSVLCLLAFEMTIVAQDAIPVSGGKAAGSGGEMSFTVGQVVYTTVSAINGTITQGVQQPYEILIVSGNDEVSEINLECSVYPNPTADFLILKIMNYDANDFSYKLFDIKGNLLKTKEITTIETLISVRYLTSGIYLLRISNNSQVVRTFKVIKK
jgi:hypothetical protein